MKPVAGAFQAMEGEKAGVRGLDASSTVLSVVLE